MNILLFGNHNSAIVDKYICPGSDKHSLGQNLNRSFTTAKEGAINPIKEGYPLKGCALEFLKSTKTETKANADLKVIYDQ